MSSCVVVLGPTGCGKSSLIKLMTGDEKIRTSQGALSCTKDCAIIDGGSRIWLDSQGTADAECKETDAEILRKIMKQLYDRNIDQVQAIWCLDDAFRMKPEFQSHAKFLASFGDFGGGETAQTRSELWSSVMIIMKQKPFQLTSSHVQGAWEAASAAGCANPKNINGFGFTCIEWRRSHLEEKKETDPAFEMTLQCPPELQKTFGFITEKEVKATVAERLTTLTAFKICFLRQKCSKCGVKGDYRFVNADCHTEPTMTHPKDWAQEHPNPNLEKYHSSKWEWYHKNTSQERYHTNRSLAKHHPSKLEWRHKSTSQERYHTKPSLEKYHSSGLEWHHPSTRQERYHTNTSLEKHHLSKWKWSHRSEEQERYHTQGTGLPHLGEVYSKQVDDPSNRFHKPGAALISVHGSSCNVQEYHPGRYNSRVGLGIITFGLSTNFNGWSCCGWSKFSSGCSKRWDCGKNEGCLLRYNCCGNSEYHDGCRMGKKSVSYWSCCDRAATNETCTKTTWLCCQESEWNSGCRLRFSCCKEDTKTGVTRGCQKQYPCCGKVGEYASGCQERWKCCKESKTVLGCRSRFSCCKKDTIKGDTRGCQQRHQCCREAQWAQGCKERWRCCQQSKQVNGCSSRFSCCKKDTKGGDTRGCQQRYRCCDKVQGAQGCEEQWKCCKQPKKVLGCRSRFSCCKEDTKTGVTRGCQQRYPCCGKVGEYALGCKERWPCCEQPKSSRGCQNRRPCCQVWETERENPTFDGCKKVCRACDNEWGSAPGCKREDQRNGICHDFENEESRE